MFLLSRPGIHGQWPRRTWASSRAGPPPVHAALVPTSPRPLAAQGCSASTPQPATLAGELGEAALGLALCASIRRNLQPQHVFRLQLECRCPYGSYFNSQLLSLPGITGLLFTNLFCFSQENVSCLWAGSGVLTAASPLPEQGLAHGLAQ